MAPAMKSLVLALALLRGVSGDVAGVCPAGDVCEEADVSLLQKTETRLQVATDSLEWSAGVEDSRCEAVGARAWLSEAGANYIVQTVFGTLVDKTFTLEYPDVKGEKNGWTYEISGASVMEYAIDLPELNFTNGVGLDLTIPKFSVNTKFHYKVDGTGWNPIWSAGTVRAELSQKEPLQGQFVVGVNKDGKPTVNLQLNDPKVKLGAFAMEGTIFEGLVEFLVSIFKEKVENSIASTVKWVIETAVNKYLNDWISKIGLQLPLQSGGKTSDVADMSLCYVEVTKQYLAFGVSGAVTDPAESTKSAYVGVPPRLRQAPPPAMLSEGHMLATELTPFTLDTGLALMQAHGVLRQVITPSDIMGGLKLDVDTARAMVPGLAVPKDGRGMSFAVHIKSDESPKVTFNDGAAEIHGHVTISLKWEDLPMINNVEFLKVSAPFIGMATVAMEEGAQAVMHMQLDSVSVTPITVIGQTTTDMSTVNSMIETVARTALLPYINRLVKNGVGLPSGNGFHLKDSKVAIVGGYLDTISDISVDMDAFKAFIDSKFD